MKKCKFGFAAIVTALVFAVCLFAGCDHGNSGNNGNSSKGSTSSNIDGTYKSSDGRITFIINGASCTYIASGYGHSITQTGTIDKNNRTFRLDGTTTDVFYTFDGNTMNFAGLKLIKQ